MLLWNTTYPDPPATAGRQGRQAAATATCRGGRQLQQCQRAGHCEASGEEPSEFLLGDPSVGARAERDKTI